MGGLFSSMWNKLFKTNKSYNILILGIANAGKTTLLYQMYFLLTQVTRKIRINHTHHRQQCLIN